MGGIGLSNLYWQSKALGAKLVWKIYRETNRKWVKIPRMKYPNGENPSNIFKTENPLKASRVWNFILDCRNLIIENITWDIAKGNKVVFWSDSWGGYSTLDNFFISPRMKEVLRELWSKNLKDYIECPSGDPTLGWRWKDLNDHCCKVCALSLLVLCSTALRFVKWLNCLMWIL